MGVLDNIYAVNYLVNREISRPGGKLITFFVDLRAAFDSIDKEVLVKAMRRGVKEGIEVRCENILRVTKNKGWVGGNGCRCVERKRVLDKGVR